MTLAIEVNGFSDFSYDYVLKRLFRVELFTDPSTVEDIFDTRCTLLEFELQSN
jgi:hypothetical protein